MSNFILSPNMSLPVPVVGVDPGPDYAENLNSSLSLVDGHDHSPGYGVQVNPNGLDINADLTMQDNNLTAIRSLRFQSQGAPIALITDLSCLYVVTESGSNGDLWFNDGSGNHIQITDNGGVLATVSALVSGSNEAQFIANQLVVTQAPNTPGNIVVGSVLLGNNSAGSNFLTLQPPNAMPASYSLTLPSVPANTQLLQIDSSGNITASGVSPAAANPAGSIIMYGGASAPAGYLLCDGTSYLRSAQPALFSAIGTAYGTADGTHFNVPDFRGIFPRGVDAGSGNDPDTLARTAANPGGNTADNVGSAQLFASQDHVHFRNALNANEEVFTLGGGGSQIATAAGTETISTPNTGGLMETGNASTETRPINLYVNFIIKA